KRPPNDIMLQLYALYKQGNEGDVTGERPGFADFEGRAKFDSWNKLQGKSLEDAKQEYIALVEQLEQEEAL
ncbi:MAG: acyl-CoA-binding protein, partial [SAR324 cluster bacterium]|nr:acyl-CoA-binding protein [SAR324 cluster bacterium]